MSNMSNGLVLAAALAMSGCQPDSTAPVMDAQPSAATASAVGGWTFRAPYPKSGFGSASASVTGPGGSVLYVIGGQGLAGGPGRITSAVKAYDVAADTWKPSAHYPVPVAFTHGAVEIDGKIYVTGGQSRRFDQQKQVNVGVMLRSLYVYDPATDSWRQRADLPILLSGQGVSGAYQGRLYVATICVEQPLCGDENRGALWRYTPATNTWVLLTRTPHNPNLGGGGFIDGKFYLIHEQLVGAGETDVYDVATDTWSVGPKRPGASCVPSYATLGARLYVTCPWRRTDGGLVVLDPKTGWSFAGPIPDNRGGNGYTMSRVVLNGHPLLELVGDAFPTNNLQYAP